MQPLDSNKEPEAMIAAMNRGRQRKLVFVLSGVVVAIVGLFGATLAMYSKDPAAGLEPAAQTETRALQPAH
jgi:hypothetical protein